MDPSSARPGLASWPGRPHKAVAMPPGGTVRSLCARHRRRPPAAVPPTRGRRLQQHIACRLASAWVAPRLARPMAPAPAGHLWR